LQDERGVFNSADIKSVLRPSDPHFPRTRLVCVEMRHCR
jgi:threonine aldolase